MSFAIGSLVRTRGREWVVLPESSDDFLMLRPLGGTEQEIAGIYVPLEQDDIQPATFDLPDPARPGDFRSCRLLRDAARLGFRSGAGPFRSSARLNVEPRPYQLVPLLMGLKLDPVRLLIADDVGIGKTIEAAMLARELLDRGEIRRIAVLCPPHLAEQWQSELLEKFNIQAELVLPGTVTRLERHTAAGQSLFDLYPFVIVSIDYIKASRRFDDFVRSCPEFVIVDEAHTCASTIDPRAGRHLRHQLVSALARDPTRHLVLVTATPHSGDEGAFRSLLGLLRPDFRSLPEDLSGPQNETIRREVALHLVQRRRADIRDYMDTGTVFPNREDAEQTYQLTPDYANLLRKVLAYARERVTDKSGSQQRQRVRWWSALALLRSLASSPAAAAATLRTRSATAETANDQEADTIGERSVLDLDDLDTSETLDIAPGSEEGEDQPENERNRLLRFAREADRLRGPDQDAKLATASTLVRQLLAEGYNPIVFCRFIPTAEYVAEALRQALPKGVEIAAVTGILPPTEREDRVQALGEHPQRVLVATDCLSEGINLQDHFDAVLHYDLSWNPTRHEQREGRVDRYGQAKPTVRTITYYGVDNQIDGIVLDVLLRKHQTIRSSLGISVPVPANTSQVVQALMQGLLLRGDQVGQRQLAFDFGSQQGVLGDLHQRWEDVTERERRSRTMFAQRALRVEEVANAWQAARQAIGAGVDVREFVTHLVQAHEGFAVGHNGTLEVTLPNQAALREAAEGLARFTARFELPVPDQVLYLNRTHPIVQGLAHYALDTALDPLRDGVARRCGAIRSRAVSQATTLLLLRLRFHIVTQRGNQETTLLAEECRVAGFAGSPQAPQWLADEVIEPLLLAVPDANIAPQQAGLFITRILAGMDDLREPLQDLAASIGNKLLEEHRHVRAAARQSGVRYSVRPQLPVDILGIYMLVPIV